jgi:hypothetical protein
MFSDFSTCENEAGQREVISMLDSFFLVQLRILLIPNQSPGQILDRKALI